MAAIRDFIKKNYKNMTYKEMALELGIGLRKLEKHITELQNMNEIELKSNRLDRKGNEFLIKNMNILTHEELAKELDCTVLQIRKKIYYLEKRGLKDSAKEKIEAMPKKMKNCGEKTIIRYPKLEKGKEYILCHMGSKGTAIKRRCTVYSETDLFYILATKHYKVCVLKKDLWIGEYWVEGE